MLQLYGARLCVDRYRTRLSENPKEISSQKHVPHANYHCTLFSVQRNPLETTTKRNEHTASFYRTPRHACPGQSQGRKTLWQVGFS